MVSASQRHALRGIVAATAGPGMLDEYVLDGPGGFDPSLLTVYVCYWPDAPRVTTVRRGQGGPANLKGLILSCRLPAAVADGRRRTGLGFRQSEDRAWTEAIRQARLHETPIGAFAASPQGQTALYVSRLLTPKDFLERLKQLIGS